MHLTALKSCQVRQAGNKKPRHLTGGALSFGGKRVASPLSRCCTIAGLFDKLACSPFAVCVNSYCFIRPDPILFLLAWGSDLRQRTGGALGALGSLVRSTNRQKTGNKKPRHLRGGALRLQVNKGESGFEFNWGLAPLFGGYR